MVSILPFDVPSTLGRVLFFPPVNVFLVFANSLSLSINVAGTSRLGRVPRVSRPFPRLSESSSFHFRVSFFFFFRRPIARVSSSPRTGTLSFSVHALLSIAYSRSYPKILCGCLRTPFPTPTRCVPPIFPVPCRSPPHH